MKCREAKKLLSAYTDGSLDRERTAAFEAHIAGCERCEHELELFSAYRERMASLKEAKAPSGFIMGVRSRIRGAEKEGPKKKPLFSLPRIKVPLELAGALAVVLIAVVIFRNVIPQKEQPPIPTVMTAPEKAGEITEPAKREEPLSPEQAKKEPPQPAVTEERELVGESRDELKVPAEKRKADSLAAVEEVQGLSKDMEELEEISDVSLTKDRLTATLPSEPPAPIDLALIVSLPTVVSAPEPVTAQQDEAVSRALMRAERVASEEAVEEEKEEYAPKAGPVLKTNGEDLSDRIRKIVEELGGMVLSLDYDGERDFPSYVTVQIPAGQYGKFLEEIKALGELKDPVPDIPLEVQEAVVARIELQEPARGFQ
jgi:hypothetical protein